MMTKLETAILYFSAGYIFGDIIVGVIKIATR